MNPRANHAYRVFRKSKRHVVEFVLPPSLAASPHARYQPRVVRSPAAHAPGVRSARSCHMPAARPGSLPGRPAVGSAWSSHTRLRQPAGAVCLRPRAQPTLRRHLAYGSVIGGRASVMRHARAAAHTLRVAARSATLSRSSAHVRSIGQRGRQRHSATAASAVTTRHQHRTSSNRISTAPTRSRHSSPTAPLATQPHQLHRQPKSGS